MNLQDLLNEFDKEFAKYEDNYSEYYLPDFQNDVMTLITKAYEAGKNSGHTEGFYQGMNADKFSGENCVNELRQEERRRLLETVKDLPYGISQDWDDAIDQVLKLLR